MRSPLRTAGNAWGPQRVKLGLSVRELARRSGVNAPTLSLVEQGRLIPTGEQWSAVMAALAAAEQEGAPA